LLSYVAINPEPEYHRCFPEELLQQIVEHALKGIEATNLRIPKKETSDPVHMLLKEAWSKFWRDPDNCVDWEKHAVTRLFDSCGSSQAGTARSC
jgi:hypothetical protein